MVVTTGSRIVITGMMPMVTVTMPMTIGVVIVIVTGASRIMSIIMSIMLTARAVAASTVFPSI